MQAFADFYDGETATRHPVHVTLGPDRMALLIRGDTLPQPLRWPLADLRALHDQSDRRQLVLTRHVEFRDETARDPARLVVDDPDFMAWLRATRPALDARDVPRGTGRRVALWIAGALAAVGLMLFVILPALADTLARAIPEAREAAFGRSVVAQMERVLGAERMGGLDCEAPAGRAALDRMAARLTGAADLDTQVTLRVLDHEMVNAFAAPGGQVVILRGLLDEAGSPETVAAVLAHELGHVARRDPTRAALRTAGSVGLLGLVFGDFAGGAAMLLVAERLIDARYSQDAEEAADLYAHELLARADIPPAALAQMFERFRELDGDTRGAFAHLMSHPRLGDRIAAARAATPEGFAGRPVLSPAEWRALQDICG
ncbi:M48 family metallopeptidase [Roseivivax isoporae]|uniref:Peptidase M48 Ste24p n=1 Tax=Roseivivax isoporae LMG 25204 TaxID=1449351 RepID=X7F5Z7_9RHOB|nr:M48 family metallopeptidase [Roseivivax isoporae]ETX27501.1 peptidase M48 Ste24p [Roseivivax isoporae LMG 25204]